MNKLDRKERRGKGGRGAGGDVEWLREHGLGLLIANELPPEGPRSGNLVFSGGLEMNIGDGSQANRALPKGTTRK